MSHPITAAFPPATVAQLAEVERRLALQAQSREPRLAEWSKESLLAGGKRVRPLLLLTAFDACGGDALGPTARGQAIDSAVALELVHTASLVHDDIMDESAERRGRPSIYAAHGRDGAILVGDYLFTQAFALAASLPKEAMALTADACRRLCEGQLREQALLASGAPDRAGYVAVIRDKTAALLAAGCAIGATMAGATPAQVQALYRYGDAIGHAFQVLDDLLDVAGDPQWTGKPAGTDFVAGTLSSPYLNFLERGGSLPPQRSADAFPGVRARLFESGAVAASQLEASGYTQAALLELEQVPPSPARAALEGLAELLMERAA
ncbi:MAG: heptaprenyl diphosphate synthase component 2 [Thermoplasmata archaeon]|jgi:octaprenyl-diphosphate synthase|nr:heptaprenyl diphosphate synthase component 2 [Thermoplasmata archaeon]